MLLTTTDVALRIGKSVSQVRRMTKNGLIKSQRIGNEYLIDEDDLKLIKPTKPGRHAKK